MGFSRQECWSGLPFPFPGDFPDPGIEPRSPELLADALTSESPGKPTFQKKNSDSEDDSRSQENNGEDVRNVIKDLQELNNKSIEMNNILEGNQ